MIDVAVGLLVNPRGDVFMGRRPYGKRFAAALECPGGKFDPARGDRTIVDTVTAEWREELGAEVEPVFPGRPAIHVTRISLDEELRAHLIPIHLIGSVTANEHAELLWLTPATAVRHHLCTPAFYAQYRLIDAYARGVAADASLPARG